MALAADFKEQSISYLIESQLNTGIEVTLKDIDTQLSQLTTQTGEMSEVEMMRFNVAVSRFNTVITLASAIYKNLCDGEKAIAQKM